MLAEIQLQAISSKKEVEDAQKFLAEAEKRWEVIAIDVDDESTSQKMSSNNQNKKRKVSTGNDNGSIGSTSSNVTRGNSTAASSTLSNAANHQIVVEGCGTEGINGVYNLVAGVSHNGAAVYTKLGEWMGAKLETLNRNQVYNFAIFRETYVPNTYSWLIGTCNENVTIGSGFKPDVRLFRSMDGVNSITPPENRWETTYSGLGRPKCKLIRNNATQSGASSGQQNNTQSSTTVDLTNNSERTGAASINLDGIDNILVSGCKSAVSAAGTYVQVSCINGNYNLLDGVLHNQAPVFVGEGLTNRDYAVFRGSMGRRHRWCIGKWIGDSPGTVYYNSPLQDGINMAPPEDGWQTTQYGIGPAPRCRLVNSSEQLTRVAETMDTIDEITVVFSRNPNYAASGTYKRNGKRNGLASFMKRGIYQGQSERFVLYHQTLHYPFRSTWIIGIPSLAMRFYESEPCHDEITIPPKSWGGVDLQY